jgi:topoisomerase IA-like protein
MDTSELLTSIDSEIVRLQEARALLAGQNGHAPRTRKPVKKHHTMSAAGRARIAAALPIFVPTCDS